MQQIFVATVFKDNADYRAEGYVFCAGEMPAWIKMLEKLMDLVYDGRMWFVWRVQQIMNYIKSEERKAA